MAQTFELKDHHIYQFSHFSQEGKLNSADRNITEKLGFHNIYQDLVKAGKRGSTYGRMFKLPAESLQNNPDPPPIIPPRKN
jgi:hypothetical protein